MAGQADHPYTITPTRMTMDNRFAGADAAAAAVGANIVQVTPVRPFASEEKPRAGRVIEPAHHGHGRNSRDSVSYLYRRRGVNDVFSGLVVRTYEPR